MARRLSNKISIFLILISLDSIPNGSILFGFSEASAAGIKMESVDSFFAADASRRLPVMVRLKNEFNDENVAKSTSGKSLEDRLNHLIVDKSSSKKLDGGYLTENLRTLSVTKHQLESLVISNEIEVFENRLHKPSLLSSVPIVFPAQSSSEFLGEGQSIVLIDTGVDASHSFLANKILTATAACFSNDNNSGITVNDGGVSLCQDEQGTTVGFGSGEACDSSIDGCFHGTMMAGIMVGSDDNHQGVAPSASLIPIQVYTKFTSNDFCGEGSAPCIFALESDIIRALQYVDSIKSRHNLAAVNISLETPGTFQGDCENDSNSSPPTDYISVIKSITESGTAVISASGNAGEANEMSSPACIGNVISAASTDDNNVASNYNNRSSELDFFAPGEDITTSTIPVSQFDSFSGTSASSAHVAGAWAVLKSKDPNSSVAKIREALTATGSPVTQGLIEKPRINIDEALATLPEPSLSEDICFPVITASGNSAIVCL